MGYIGYEEVGLKEKLNLFDREVSHYNVHLQAGQNPNCENC